MERSGVHKETIVWMLQKNSRALQESGCEESLMAAYFRVVYC